MGINFAIPTPLWCFYSGRDFGCETGSSTRFLRDLLGAQSVLGADRCAEVRLEAVVSCLPIGAQYHALCGKVSPRC